MMHSTSFAILALTGLAALPAAQNAARPAGPPVPASDVVELPSPFVRLGDGGPAGYVTVSFDRTSSALMAAAHEKASLVRLSDLPLPGGESVDLLLRPTSVMEPGATAVVIAADGTRSRLAPSLKAFSGNVAGTGGAAFLGISDEMLHGYVTLGDRTLFVSSGPDGPGTATIAPADLFEGTPFERFCGTVSSGEDGVSLPVQAGVREVRSTMVFLELDNQYRAQFPTDQAALDYAVLLNTATSEIYRRDIACVLTIPSGYIQVWNATPPWGVTSSFGDLDKFGNWWTSGANPNKALKRAVVHLLTNPVFGGVAQSVGPICQKTTSFAISSVNGSFPYPIQHTNNGNWDLQVYSHETGHIYGSQHTFDYNPPINCEDGSGPDKGTIMSYCHLNFGTGQVGMRFHARVQDTIAGWLLRAPCAPASPVMRGDYDMTGAVDSADLAAFDAYVVQGFTSRGAHAAFDLNLDGTVDADDRAILELLTQGAVPPASSSPFNGTEVNCSYCFAPISEPVLGQTWSTYVGGMGGGFGEPQHLTTIIGGSTELTPPILTKWGELLIGINGFGGQTYFTRTRLTEPGETFARYDIPIPYETNLIGRTVYAQAGHFLDTGLVLVNGMELNLSPY